MNIDWSKAPELAVAHGLHETGFGIKEFWLGETQYQNLEHAKSFPYGGGDPSCGSFHNSRRESFSYVTTRPIPWNGEGLPPVGTRCDVFNNELSGPEWESCTILYSGKFRVMYDSESCYERVGFIDNLKFRQTRTPEQIAAEERESSIEAMNTLVGDIDSIPTWTDALAKLYDAGYRKFEIVDGE